MDSCLASFRSGISSSIRLWRCHAVSGSSAARCWALSSRMRCPSSFAASSYWAPISRSVMASSSVHLDEVLFFLAEEAVHGLDVPDSRPALHLGRRNEPPAVRALEQANLRTCGGFLDFRLGFIGSPRSDSPEVPEVGSPAPSPSAPGISLRPHQAFHPSGCGE